MSAMDRNPLSTNLASPLNFLFVLKRAPALTYFCTGVKLPYVAIDPAIVNSPSLEVAYPGDHIKYSPITLSFKVDENFQNWQEVLNWMNGISNPENDGIVYTQLEIAGEWTPYTIYSDVSVIQLDSQNNPILDWSFDRAFPIALSGPEFNSKSDDVVFLESTVVLKYTKFSIKRLVLPSNT
jgi:hypothetical protein